MSHITRYGKRMKLMLITAMAVASFICLFAIPFVGDKLLYNEVGYYSLRINSVEVGKANSRAEARQAVANARKRLSKEYSDTVYMDLKYEVVKENSLIADRMSVEELEAAAYSQLLSCITELKGKFVYTLRVGDYTVSLAKSEDIVEALEMVTAQYDTRNEYEVSLNSLGSADEYEVSLVKSEADNNAADIVSAILNGDTAVKTEDGTVVHDGITSLEFLQNVTVSISPADKTEVVSVEEAYAQLTQTTEETVVYYVQAGDTLSDIADNYQLELEQIYELNPSLTEDTVLAENDEVLVKLQTPVITVVETKRETYEEEYMAQPEYVYDSEAQKGVNEVVSEGEAGTRKVTAEVTYINGKKSNVNITEETIITQAEPQVISVGTSVSSQYTKPIQGELSLEYNAQEHTGVDFKASEGTEVKAAADGTVVRAGWYSDYGYCVDISHEDGSMTRYAHLSTIEVSLKQTVTQGQLIARSGSTGTDKEPHLHFELWINDKPVNPLNYINKN